MQQGNDFAQWHVTGILEASVKVLGLCCCGAGVPYEVSFRLADAALSGASSLSTYMADAAEDEGNDGRSG